MPRLDGPPAMPPPAQAASQLLSPRAACAGGPQQPCSGNGRCDGDGTRRGTGLCVCSPGYGGPFCAECGDGYYEASRNKSHLICAGTSRGLARWGVGLGAVLALGAGSSPLPAPTPLSPARRVLQGVRALHGAGGLQLPSLQEGLGAARAPLHW